MKGEQMGRFYRLAIVALAAIAGSALLVASTGSGATGAKRGGTLKLISAGDVDSVDPGQTYYSYGWQVLTAVHRTLYATPANSVKTVPDLAAAMPKISADGKTVTVRIKKGVRFGPPVNREVTSADVKYAIERSFSVSVTNGYVNLYFSDLVGAPAKPPKTPKPVSGIKTPNKYTIVFKLKQPRATLASALVMTNTAPIPKEYAAKYDSKTTSDYGFYQAATGPYMFEADDDGNIKGEGYTPGRSMKLVRNPNWSRKGDFRPAYVDEIEVKEGFTDTSVGVRQILNGTADGAGDYAVIPGPTLKQLQTNEKYGDNLYFWPNGIGYLALNTQKKPFDNLNVRRAANFVMDKNAIRLVQGGPVTGRIATHVLGPEFKGKGFEAAGGYGFDPYKTPNHSGSVAKAKAEMRKAGYANGMYDGPAITMYTFNSTPSPQTAKVMAASLAKIGIKVNIKLASIDAMFTKFCVVLRYIPEICTLGWLPDFKDPVTMLDPLFNGKAINPNYTNNVSLLDDPQVNAAIEKAKKVKNTNARYAAWGKVDHLITLKAAVVMTQWLNVPNVVSDRIVPAKSLWNAGLLDLSATWIK
jgi:peptide/nickel transport system substrate-binding protein